MKLPMLLLSGKVDNIYLTPEKEDQQGNKYGNDYKVQLLVDQPQENGEIKRGLVDVKTEYPDYFRLMQDRQVSLPVRVYVFKGDVGYSILRAWSPPSSPPAGSADVAVDQRESV